jgi:hypothetical protein
LQITGSGPVEFVFVALPARGDGSWGALKAQFPPAEGSGLEVDLEPWSYAAIAASCTSPKMAAADVERLAVDVLNDAEFQMLWMACIAANMGVNRPESSAASAPTARTRRSSKPRSGSGGRTASS